MSEPISVGSEPPITSEPIDEKKNASDVHAPVDPVSHSGSEEGETPVGGTPNQYEQQTLRRVGEWLPFGVFLVAVIELCERFTYYGCQGLFQNYVSNPQKPGPEYGLDLGHEGATGLTTFFQFWCYVTPVLGGIVADQYVGKYKAILGSSGIYIIGLLILVCTSIPESLPHGKTGLGGYVTAIILIGFGTGGIKANVAPLIAEQYTRRHLEISETKKGERVIIDPYVTIQHIYMMFYWTINIGSLSMIATPCTLFHSFPCRLMSLSFEILTPSQSWNVPRVSGPPILCVSACSLSVPPFLFWVARSTSTGHQKALSSPILSVLSAR